MHNRTRSLFLVVAIVVQSSAAVAQSAGHTAATPSNNGGPSRSNNATTSSNCDANSQAEAGFSVELSSLNNASAERSEWTQRLSLVTNSHGTLRFIGANGALVDVSLSLRPSRDVERVIVEIDLREERSRGAQRSSRHTRQALLVRRGESALLGGAWPDGEQRFLRVTVR